MLTESEIDGGNSYVTGSKIRFEYAVRNNGFYHLRTVGRNYYSGSGVANALWNLHNGMKWVWEV